MQEELGIQCVDVDTALADVDVVILAIPDTLIGKVSHEISPKLKAGTMVMTLDAAAPFAGHLPDRKDLTYFVAHPCHPLHALGRDADTVRDAQLWVLNAVSAPTWYVT